MLFTGYNVRSIYSQDNLFSYLATVSLSNTSGKCEFGFSGNIGVFGLKFENSEIYTVGSQPAFLDGYDSNILYSISGNAAQNSYDIFINNYPTLIQKSKPPGYYNYFYINSQNVTTDLSLEIFGKTPNYSYSPFKSFYSGETIPITLNNSGNYPFKIFSGEILNNINNFSLTGAYNVNIPSNGSGTISLKSNSFSPFSQNIPIQLYTNFGNIILDFSASGIPSPTGNFYILLGPDNTVINNGDVNLYTATVRSYTGINLYLSLEYISGYTGKVYSPEIVNNSKTGVASGIITGSGDLNSLTTGIIAQYNSITSGNESGTGYGILSKFVYATGNVSENFTTKITGLGSGLISALGAATGYGVFTFNGLIVPPGGILTRENLTGLGTGYFNGLLFTGYINSGIGSVFAPYTGNLTEISGIFNSNEYESVNFKTPLLFFTGEIRKFYAITGLAWATGGILTGLMQGDFGNVFEPGIYTFNKSWTGLGSGQSAIINSFDPVMFFFEKTGTSGTISGNYFTGLNVNGCDFNEPYFIPTGVPTIIYDDGGNVVNPIDIFLLKPLNTGEYLNENSSNINSRTNISRRGNTASGTGYFDNVFREPFYDSGIWTEYLTGYNTSITGDFSKIISVGASPIIRNEEKITGYFTISGDYTGFQKFIWNGKIISGNYLDYSTRIFSLNNNLINKVYNNSYNFEMILKTGKYGFEISPLNSTAITENTNFPMLVFNKTITIPEAQNTENLLFSTSVPIDYLKVTVQSQDGSMRNGIDYSGINSILEFNNSALQNIININTNSGSNGFFYLKILNIEGDYIANKNEIINSLITVKKNIDNNLDEDCCYNLPPTNENLDSVILCKQLLADWYWSNKNIGLNELIQFPVSVPAGYTLPASLYAEGMVGDILKIKANTIDGESILLINSEGLVGNRGEPFIYSGLLSIPSLTKSVNVDFVPILRAHNAPRWEVSLDCDQDNNDNRYPDLSCNRYDIVRIAAISSSNFFNSYLSLNYWKITFDNIPITYSSTGIYDVNFNAQDGIPYIASVKQNILNRHSNNGYPIGIDVANCYAANQLYHNKSTNVCPEAQILINIKKIAEDLGDLDFTISSSWFWGYPSFLDSLNDASTQIAYQMFRGGDLTTGKVSFADYTQFGTNGGLFTNKLVISGLETEMYGNYVTNPDCSDRSANLGGEIIASWGGDLPPLLTNYPNTGLLIKMTTKFVGGSVAKNSYSAKKVVSDYPLF